MHAQHRALVILNLVGGPAVLGSYVHGAMTHPGTASVLWGDIPVAVQPVYTANMFVAAAGYLYFTWTLLRRVDPEALERPRFGWFLACYALILAGSAAWMPVSFAVVDGPSPALLPFVWLALAAAAAGSLGVLAGLRWARLGRGPVIAAALFCGQTVVLDFLIWPWFFNP